MIRPTRNRLAPITKTLTRKRGMIAVATGLLLANALSLAAALPRRLRPWSFLVLAFAGVGVVRWPLLLVMGALAPLAMAAVWRR